MTKVLSRFRHHFSVIQDRLSSDFVTLNLQGQKPKNVSHVGYFSPSYETLGVTGDFTRVYINQSDAAAINAMKKAVRREYETQLIKPVVVKHNSISFKFFYEENLEDSKVVVSTRRAGMEYPLTDKSPQLSLEQLRVGLLHAMKSDFDGEELIVFLAEVFVDKPHEYIDPEIKVKELLKQSAVNDFEKVVNAASEKFYFQDLGETDSEEVTKSFSEKVRKALAQTDEFKEYAELEKKFRAAQIRLNEKRKKIEASHLKKESKARDIIAFNKEGETKLLEAIEVLYQGYSNLEPEERGLVGECLYNATRKLLTQYSSYRKHLPSRYNFQYLADRYGVPRSLIPALL